MVFVGVYKENKTNFTEKTHIEKTFQVLSK